MRAQRKQPERAIPAEEEARQRTAVRGSVPAGRMAVGGATGLSPGMVASLQRAAGNAAASTVIARAKTTGPRSTERRILDNLEAGVEPTAADFDALAAKMAKGQTKERAREITASTESEFAEILGKFDGPQRTSLKEAIRSYTQDSAAINTHARSGANTPGARAQVDKVDSVFTHYNDADRSLTEKNRITYRLTTYKPERGDPEVPYGTTITVGDYITDLAFVSASENRRLLVEGVNNAMPGTRYVKFTIIGSGGANIAGGSPYTNAAEEKMHNLAARGEGIGAKLKRAFGTPPSGQAEILYPRDSAFRVEKISANGDDVLVVVRSSSRQEAEAVGRALKDSFTGSEA
jgi:insecticidal toxin complex protein TccC